MKITRKWELLIPRNTIIELDTEEVSILLNTCAFRELHDKELPIKYKAFYDQLAVLDDLS